MARRNGRAVLRGALGACYVRSTIKRAPDSETPLQLLCLDEQTAKHVEGQNTLPTCSIHVAITGINVDVRLFIGHPNQKATAKSQTTIQSRAAKKRPYRTIGCPRRGLSPPCEDTSVYKQMQVSCLLHNRLTFQPFKRHFIPLTLLQLVLCLLLACQHRMPLGAPYSLCLRSFRLPLYPYMLCCNWPSFRGTNRNCDRIHY